ncbi:MAG: hypothetical protein ACI9MR_004668 [Myxococcota bacterium]|jgi:hypothetical protein
MRLVDSDDDGVADGATAVVYSGLPPWTTSLAEAGSLVVVVTAQEGAARLTFLRRGATPDSTLTYVDALEPTFMNHPYHQTHAVAARPSDAMAGAWDIVFNIGSAQTAVATSTTVEVGGIVSGTLAADGLAMVTIIDDGDTILATGLVQSQQGSETRPGSLLNPRAETSAFRTMVSTRQATATSH